MPAISFSSDQLPAHLDDKRKFALWCELYDTKLAGLDFGKSDAPFEARMSFSPFGHVGLGRMSGSIVRSAHGRARSSSTTSDHFGLVFGQGEGSIRVRSGKKENIIAANATMLVSSVEPEEFTSDQNYSAWTLIHLPRAAVLRTVPNADDLVGTALRTGSEALSMLQGYAALTLDNGATEPRLQAHIAQTFTDLISLALGAERDDAEVACRRGLKSARLESILKAIADGYNDPEFSVAGVARQLRVSERYVQDVLHGTGKSFSERVMELRLQHAAGLLSHTAARDRKVSDIAFSSGFSDLSYFHRCYRRRFGMTPAGARVH